MNLKSKIKTLTAKQVVGGLIEGLKNPNGIVRMSTYGDCENGICISCAASNAIQKIFNVKYNPDLISNRMDRLHQICPESNKEQTFSSLERALDSLRLGNIEDYNYIAKKISLVKIPVTTMELPQLDSANYMINLKHYEDFLKTL